MPRFESIHDVTKYLYYQYLCVPIYFIEGIKYCAKTLQAEKAKIEYLEKKEKADKTKENIINTSSLLFAL